jgi:poly-gamma-glutamate synthesis protein (capsule biosynthesis protein)
MKKVLRVGGIVGGFLLIVGASFLLCAILLRPNRSDVALGPESPLEPDPEPKAVSANMRILFTGTTFWGRRTNTKARASELGVTYPFSQLNTLHRENYDSWIGGLECPVTNNGHNAYAEENLFEFNCDPDYLPEASKYFTGFLLGNNHTDNQGPEGFAETKQHLQENGIQYFGSYEYADGENNCGVLSLPVNVALDNEETRRYKLPIAFCSAHGVFGIPTEANRANVEKHAQVLPTVVMPHMGAEYQTSADQLRQNLYREYINRGADAVIGDHPHTIQNVEAYNGRLIVYSMGNFMFDQATMETARSAAIDAAVSVNIDGVDFEAWDKLAQQCEAANGMCYDLVAAAGLPKLQLTWKYDYRGTTTDYNTLIPHAANESESVSIGQRLNWAALPAELKQ